MASEAETFCWHFERIVRHALAMARVKLAEKQLHKAKSCLYQYGQDLFMAKSHPAMLHQWRWEYRLIHGEE